MELEAAERAILSDAANQLGVVAEALIRAIENESAAELAQVLGISEMDAALRLEPILRTTTVRGDWGAGCKLMTDEVRAQLASALRSLLQPHAHSASLGVSQG